MVSLDDVREVDLLEKACKVGRFLLGGVHGQSERQAAVHNVLGPTCLTVTVERPHELREG